MLCFKCKSSHNDIDKLIFHFKNSHNLNSRSPVRCNDCGQMFTLWSRFKRHVIRHHNFNNQNDLINDNINLHDSMNSTGPLPVDINIPITPTTIINVSDTSQFNEFEPNTYTDTSVNDNTTETPHKKFDLNNHLKTNINMALTFSLFLHNNNNFSRKDVLEVQKHVNQYIINPLLDAFISFAKSNFQNEQPSLYNNFSSLVSNLRNPFKLFDSDYKLYSFLKNEGYATNFKEVTINDQLMPAHRAGKLQNKQITTKGILMPLKFQFKTFFEVNKLIRPTLNYITSLKQNNIRLTNFIQGELWKEKIKLYPRKTLIPYILYVDDFEINNPLGSNSSKHSICNLYYSFPCLPMEESRLENIFYAAITKTSDLKQFGNEKCFECLIDELKDLEISGIDINDGNNEIIKIHFILGLVVGDNLGLNSFLNFSKSFSSNYFCRLCRAPKEMTQKLSCENSELMRTEENYQLDVSNPNSKGVYNESLLNNIPSFHVVKNYYADIMHDLFEGVCHYNIIHIINYFITSMKYFDLDVLNSRKQLFDYGPKEIENISPTIQLHHLKKKKLKMSAREMMTFIMYFPIMIGDLVPSDDIVWKFLINFIEIVDILLCFEVDECSILILENKIKTHNSDYITLFNDTLKPKFHNLTHYPNIIRQSGPLRKIWCFNFEQKHKQFKVYSHCITSRKNICLTLAKKYELKFAFQLLKGTNFVNTLTSNENHLIENSNFENIIKNKLPYDHDVSIEFYSRIHFKGIEYNQGCYISVFNKDILLNLIHEIVIVERKHVLFFCQNLHSVKFDDHILAYEVDPLNLGSFSMIAANEIIGPPIHIIRTAKGKQVIRLKEYFRCV